MLWSSLSQRIVHKSAAGRFAWGPQVMQWLGQAASHRDQYSQIYINNSVNIGAWAKLFQKEQASLKSPSYKVLSHNNECL